MKKLCLAVAAAALSLLMPLCAMAAPDMTGSVINVTAADAQALLDGEFGSINGKTINFTQDVTVVLDLARPTAHAGSGTLYRRYNTDSTLSDKTSDPTGMTNHSWYYRTLQNVTFTADEGVKVAGFSFSSGHVHGTDGYDYVRGVQTGGGVTYYRYSSLDNIRFEGLTITENCSFMLYIEDTSVDGVVFDGCTFTGKAGVAAIDMLSDSMYFENTTVKDCTITDYFQGVYIKGADGATVANNTIKNTEHNAISIQSLTNNETKGNVTIKENFISNAGDRAIRFTDIAGDAVVNINNNIMVNSGNSDGELIKANVASGAKVNLENNYWDGEDASKAVAGNLTKPEAVGIVGGTFKETVTAAYCAPGFVGAQNADGTFTAVPIGNLSGLPHTGDQSSAMAWLLLLCASCAGVIGLRKRVHG